MNETTVAVLGCGPAGLLAALAATQRGYDVVIYSVRKKSKIHGAQVLHVPINGLTAPDPDRTIDIIKMGEKAVYASKVYGNSQATVSWDQYEDKLDVWSMDAAYDDLWTAFQHAVINQMVDRAFVEDLCTKFKYVISSVPLPILVPDGEYTWQDVYITTQKVHNDGGDFILWNGRPEEPWYRSSLLFGHMDVEFSHPPTGSFYYKLRKPLSNRHTQTALPQVLRVGRYGEFQKGVLIHDAYENTKEFLSDLHGV